MADEEAATVRLAAPAGTAAVAGAGSVPPMKRPQADGHKLMTGGIPLNNGMLCTSRFSMGATSADNLDLPAFDYEEVVHNLNHCEDVHRGGQAEVYLFHWKPLASGSIDRGSAEEGTFLAFKHLQRRRGNGAEFCELNSEAQFEDAQRFAIRSRRMELNVLGILHASGCGSRVVKPVGVVGWPGEWMPDPETRKEYWWKPTYGYIMPAFERGSVATLLSDICHRHLPATAAQRFLNLATLSSELATLLGELHKIHTTKGVGLMIQDLTSNNILVDDSGPTGMRLLLSDPAMALPMQLLKRKNAPGRSVMGTWLWGSMRTRCRQYDSKADLYSLCFCFAEMWLVAEGAGTPAMELIVQMGADTDMARGVQFMRALLLETVRNHHHNGQLQARTTRHLPVSWLGAWLLLLGFRDYASQVQLDQGLPCLRPEEADVLELATLWARIAAAAEVLPEGLTAEEAQSAAHQPLVSDMCTMLARLLALSHLEHEDQYDIALLWLSSNFMAQEHPLVAAMKAQGAKGVWEPEGKAWCRSWPSIVEMARLHSGLAVSSEQVAAQSKAHYAELHRGRLYEQKMAQLWQCLAGTLKPEQLGMVPLDVQLYMRQARRQALTPGLAAPEPLVAATTAAGPVVAAPAAAGPVVAGTAAEGPVVAGAIAAAGPVVAGAIAAGPVVAGTAAAPTAAAAAAEEEEEPMPAPILEPQALKEQGQRSQQVSAARKRKEAGAGAAQPEQEHAGALDSSCGAINHPPHYVGVDAEADVVLAAAAADASPALSIQLNGNSNAVFLELPMSAQASLQASCQQSAAHLYPGRAAAAAQTTAQPPSLSPAAAHLVHISNAAAAAAGSLSAGSSGTAMAGGSNGAVQGQPSPCKKQRRAGALHRLATPVAGAGDGIGAAVLGSAAAGADADAPPASRSAAVHPHQVDGAFETCQHVAGVHQAAAGVWGAGGAAAGGTPAGGF